MGTRGKKVQFLHSKPNHGIIPSQGGILSCGLAGEQFMPHGLSSALSVYTIRCELTPGEGGNGRAGKVPGTLGQTTSEGQLPTKTPPCSSLGWGALGAPHFHCSSAGWLHEYCSPVSSAPSIFLSWESTKGWEKRRKEPVPVLE